MHVLCMYAHQTSRLRHLLFVVPVHSLLFNTPSNFKLTVKSLLTVKCRRGFDPGSTSVITELRNVLTDHSVICIISKLANILSSHNVVCVVDKLADVLSSDCVI